MVDTIKIGRISRDGCRNFHTASAVNMNLATGDYQALENLTSRTRYSARQIELLVGAAGGPPFQRMCGGPASVGAGTHYGLPSR